MKICSFCKKLNDRANHKYCKKCHALYAVQQKSLNPAIKNIDSDSIHKRKFVLCKNCDNELALPRSKYCKPCGIIFTKNEGFKELVRAFTYTAVKKGYIEKPKHCEKCVETKIEAHHDDYLKPLDIIWLCKQHHDKRHIFLRKKTHQSDASYGIAKAKPKRLNARRPLQNI